MQIKSKICAKRETSRRPQKPRCVFVCASVCWFFSTDAAVYVCVYVCLTVLSVFVCVSVHGRWHACLPTGPPQCAFWLCKKRCVCARVRASAGAFHLWTCVCVCVCVCICVCSSIPGKPFCVYFSKQGCLCAPVLQNLSLHYKLDPQTQASREKPIQYSTYSLGEWCTCKPCWMIDMHIFEDPDHTCRHSGIQACMHACECTGI